MLRNYASEHRYRLAILAAISDLLSFFLLQNSCAELCSSLKVTDRNVIGKSYEAWNWCKLFSHRHSRIQILTPRPAFSKNSGCQTSWQSQCLTDQWTTTHVPSAGPRWKSEDLLVELFFFACVCTFLICSCGWCHVFILQGFWAVRIVRIISPTRRDSASWVYLLTVFFFLPLDSMWFYCAYNLRMILLCTK